VIEAGGRKRTCGGRAVGRGGRQRCGGVARRRHHPQIVVVPAHLFEERVRGRKETKRLRLWRGQRARRQTTPCAGGGWWRACWRCSQARRRRGRTAAPSTRSPACRNSRPGGNPATTARSACSWRSARRCCPRTPRTCRTRTCRAACAATRAWWRPRRSPLPCATTGVRRAPDSPRLRLPAPAPASSARDAARRGGCAPLAAATGGAPPLEPS